MADINSQVEIQDNSGSTGSYSGTGTTTVTNIPSVADKVINQCLIISDDNNFQVSLDAGSTYLSLGKGDSLTWDVKGKITQLKVKTSSGTADYRIMINFEDY